MQDPSVCVCTGTTNCTRTVQDLHVLLPLLSVCIYTGNTNYTRTGTGPPCFAPSTYLRKSEPNEVDEEDHNVSLHLLGSFLTTTLIHL
jgi:hypothetical protein